MGYEVMPGNIQDRQALTVLPKKIRRSFGKARRTWIMDRGILTEETLQLMRRKRHWISYRGRDAQGAALGDGEAPGGPAVAPGPGKGDGEAGERAGRGVRVGGERRPRQQGARDAAAPDEGAAQAAQGAEGQAGLGRDDLLVKLGQTKQKAGRAYGLVQIVVGKEGQGWSYGMDRQKLRVAWRWRSGTRRATWVESDLPLQVKPRGSARGQGILLARVPEGAAAARGAWRGAGTEGDAGAPGPGVAGERAPEDRGVTGPEDRDRRGGICVVRTSRAHARECTVCPVSVAPVPKVRPRLKLGWEPHA